MDALQLLDLLAELASEAGIQVQVLQARGAQERELMPQSGVCRVRGEVRVILVAGEPLEDRIDAVAAALRDHAGNFLETRFLPPAVRERIGAPEA